MALTATAYAGVGQTGTNKSPYWGSWDLDGAAGADSVTITHGIDMTNLQPAAGGYTNTASPPVLVPTTALQATKISIVPTNEVGANAGAFWVSSVTATTVVVNTAAAAGTARIFIERAVVNGQ